MPALGGEASLGYLALGWAGLGAGAPPPVIVRKTQHLVLFAGEVLEDALHSQIQLSFKNTHGTATVQVRRKPAIGAEDDPIEIWGGTINRRGEGTFARRFKGTVVRFDTDSLPRMCGLICKDQLYPLERYRQPSAAGLTIADITGSPTATASQMVMGVLDILGVSYNPANIADTVRILGTIAPEQYRWKHPTTAQTFLGNLLTQATAGFSLFQSGDSEIWLAQVRGRPRVAADFALVEGYNVVGSSGGSRGTEDRLTGVHVTGYDNGRGGGPVVYDVPAASPELPQVEHTSSLIETLAHATEIGDYLLEEADRQAVRTRSCTTPDDAVLGLGQTHVLDLPRNEITEPAFCQTLTITIGDNGFRQTPGHLGGGLPADDPVLP